MNTKEHIKVMLVDDHNVVRSGLGALLSAYDDLELVAEASSGEEALIHCQDKSPDVVLMDLVMPGMDGATTTEKLLEICSDVKVLALTSFKEKELVQGALRAGAMGYLLKNVSADELAEAIRSVYAGQSALAPEAAQVLIQSTRDPKGPVDYGLTAREREVLALLVEGMTNQEIAQQLVVSISTTKFHVSSILSKMGATSRTEAVAEALKSGLLDEE
jgi:NarL family two-component system response regulator LiaR